MEEEEEEEEEEEVQNLKEQVQKLPSFNSH